MKYDFIEPTMYGELALKSNGKVNLNHTPIRNYIDNYYMTDAISRQSIVMAKCSTAFNPDRHDNFKRE